MPILARGSSSVAGTVLIMFFFSLNSFRTTRRRGSRGDARPLTQTAASGGDDDRLTAPAAQTSRGLAGHSLLRCWRRHQSFVLERPGISRTFPLGCKLL